MNTVSLSFKTVKILAQKINFDWIHPYKNENTSKSSSENSSSANLAVLVAALFSSTSSNSRTSSIREQCVRQADFLTASAET